ncbi:MAG TPA: hypothetical protein VNQ80_14070 [Parapedobacter sp.]|uniref:hypothetical protein n=1 Tax=Parapedobacter sp. TaxID=1958893 RepID=UPI002C5EC5E9|nr:hypothetical protein [Parapedobacter sp.]HWK58466.1 hypothetical protein [Parapedobacter sp.]
MNKHLRLEKPASQPAKRRLRKVNDAEDYVDFLHEQAAHPGPRPFPWPLVGVPLLLILFLYLGPLLWWLDATAAVPDIGILSVLVLAALAVGFFWLVAAWLACVFFKRLTGFDRGDFHSSFSVLKPWKQIGYYLLLLLSLFWGLVVALVALI